MKLTITVEDGTVALEPRLSATHSGMAFGEPTEADKAAELDHLIALLKDTQERAERYRKLAEESTATNQKLVEDLAKAKLDQRGWRLPKRGDKVRCVQEIPKQDAYDTPDHINLPKVGDEFTVSAIGATMKSGKTTGVQWEETATVGIVQTTDNKDGTFTNRWLPIEHFEPV